MECSSVISAVSLNTTTPKIGSSIMNVYSRTPALVSMTAVTLDTISNGRLVLGLGASSKPIVEDWHGLEYAKSLQRVKEYVEIIRLAISGEKVNYAGKFFDLRNFSLLVKPVRKHIPIYLGAVNKKMVELCWDIADGVIFYLRPLDELRQTIVTMQNRRKIDVACQVITCVAEDEEMAIKRAKKTIAFYVSVGKIYREFLANNGFRKETEAIFEEYEKTGLKTNHVQVTDSMVESLAVCGTPDVISKKLRRFSDVGVDIPIIQFNPIGNVTESFRLLISSLEDVIA